MRVELEREKTTTSNDSPPTICYGRRRENLEKKTETQIALFIKIKDKTKKRESKGRRRKKKRGRGISSSIQRNAKRRNCTD